MEPKEYYSSLPKKRMGAGALFFDSAGKVLLVKPTYKDTWEIPGGVVESDESPLECCKREVQEELGLELDLLRLLAVDYSSKNGDLTESLHFLFVGATLTDAQIQQIELPSDELSEFRFFSPEDAPSVLGPRLKERLEFALSQIATGGTYYLENQEEPASITN